MNILGISCFCYNSAACLLRDGEIVAAVREERFSRRKYDSRFPRQAIDWCLNYGGVNLNGLDYIACSLDNIAGKLMASCNFGLTFGAKTKFFPPRDSFLSGAFYPSPFNESAILVNAAGARPLFGHGIGNRIHKLDKANYKFSLGLLYSAVSRYLGFNNYGDEFKVMGLAAYGKPKYKDIILKYKEKSPFYLSERRKGFSSFLAWSRGPGGITQYHMDVAASLQEAASQEVLQITQGLHKETKSDNLCLAGDLALNCLINSDIIRQGLFKNIWIQPASDNAGRAVGAALSVWYENNGRDAGRLNDMMQGSLLGPAYSDAYIESFLKKAGASYRRLADSEIAVAGSDLIARGKIVGWFQGKAEFGPRALGDRSILGDSRDLSMPKKLNLEVKMREPFRPFAPSVLWEKSGEYFDFDRESPYMLFTAKARANKKNEIPAVVHADGSSRLQTIKKEDNPLFYDLLNEFYKKTGCPVIINTSFNAGREPMVLTPEDAYRCFKSAKIDCLFLGPFLLEKSPPGCG
ncbi:MAG: carbamoyltransferase C-terminal domain-containing protein [Candidatus Omnitrophota bacterium]